MKKTIIGIVASVICFTLVAPDSFAANSNRRVQRRNSSPGFTVRDQGENAQVGNQLQRRNSFSGMSNNPVQRADGSTQGIYSNKYNNGIELLDVKNKVFGNGFANFIQANDAILKNVIVSTQQLTDSLNEVHDLLQKSGRDNYKGKIKTFLSNDVKVLETLLNALSELAITADTERIDKVLSTLNNINVNSINLYAIKLIRLSENLSKAVDKTQLSTRGIEGKYANARSQLNAAYVQLKRALADLNDKWNAVSSVLSAQENGLNIDWLNSAVFNLGNSARQTKSILDALSKTEGQTDKFENQNQGLQSQMNANQNEASQQLSVLRTLKSLQQLFIRDGTEYQSHPCVQLAIKINEFMARLKTCISESNSIRVGDIPAELDAHLDQHSIKARASTFIGGAVNTFRGKIDSLRRTRSDASFENRDYGIGDGFDYQPLVPSSDSASLSTETSLLPMKASRQQEPQQTRFGKAKQFLSNHNPFRRK